MLKVIHVNHNDLLGGAARAANRLHFGMRRIGIDSRMVVTHKVGDNPYVHCPLGKYGRIGNIVRQYASDIVLRCQHTTNTVLHSLNLFPSGLAAWLNQSDADVINLHWLGHETLSIAEVAAIEKPIVWTMHDMWPFSGAEHYDNLSAPGRWGAGYLRNNRSLEHGGLDLDSWVFHRKRRMWRNKTFYLASPSRWLADCAGRSALFSRMPCRVLPNGLNLDVYAPLDRRIARGILNLPQDKQFILFGAVSSTSDQRKGFHLLQPALASLSANGWSKRAELLIFGASTPSPVPEFGLPTHYLGHFADDIALAVLYAAADVFVAPSMQDNLPNTLLESMAVGTPCVSFDVGGIGDLVEHGRTGYLARPFNGEDLASGIDQVLRGDAAAFRRVNRDKAVEYFSDITVASNYLSYYQEILAGYRGAV